jgi:dGTPase
LFSIGDLAQVPLIGPILAQARADYPDIDDRLLRLEAVRRMIGAMIDDVMAETRLRAVATGVTSAADVRALSHALVGFSRDMLEDLSRLREFLHERMYRHPHVNRSRAQARIVLAELFDRFMAAPDDMPSEWAIRAAGGEMARARAVCDYVAGMTDRYAFEEHRRLFGAREGVDGWA